MAVKPGWTGRVFEDFEVGDIYEHPLGRTVTQADNIWFTCLTMNTNPIPFNMATIGSSVPSAFGANRRTARCATT